jgi:hypothetical protein
MPQAAMTLQTMMQVGQPFNIKVYLTRVAEEMGITEWVEDLFEDPEFLQRMQLMQSMGPQNSGKAGTTGGGMNTTQNGGFPVQRTVQSQPTLQQTAQQGANLPGGQMNPSMMGV